MNNEDKLIKDWKECLENIRFFRNQINKLAVWQIGLLPLIGIGVSIKFMNDGNFLFSGISLIVLFFIMGFIDNITHINARYSLICIYIGQDIEKKLGTNLVSKIGNRWNEKLKEDKKTNFLKRFDSYFFHVNNIRVIKYVVLILGIILIIFNLFL